MGNNGCWLKRDNAKSVFEKALMVYGEGCQLDIAIEEMAELTQAISKFKRGKDHNIEEEVADVLIMMQQIQMMSFINKSKIYGIMQKKIERLGKRLDSNG